MLRRTIALFIVLVLTMGLMPGTAQGGAPLNQDVAMPEEDWVLGAALYQDSILLSGGNIYRLVPGHAEVEVLQSFGDTAWREKYPKLWSLNLVSAGDALYGLSTNEGMLYGVTVQEQGITLDEGVALDLTPLKDTSTGDEGYIMPPAQMVIADGRLYVIGMNYGMQGPEVKLVSYDIKAGGAPTLHKAEHIQQLAPYKDGKLLALVMNPADMYISSSGTRGVPGLMVFNPAEDTLTELTVIDIPWRYEGAGLAYDAETDYVYLSMGTDVHRLDAQGNREVCAYLNPSNRGGEFNGRLLLLPDGRLAASNGEGVSIRSADPRDLPAERLTIYGGYMDDTHKLAMQAMAGTSVNFLEGKYYSTAQELGQALAGGEDSIDIFMLSTDGLDLNSLMQKGYAADLSGSQVVRDHMSGLYPMMAEAGTYQGQVLLVPVNMLYGTLYSYYPLIADQVGVALPTTFDAFCDLLEQWNDELGEKHPDILPIHAPDYNMLMTSMALQLYAAEATATGKPFTFADPQLKQMLQRAMSLRTQDIAEKVDWNVPGADMGEIYSKAPMMESWFSLDLQVLNALFDTEQGKHFIGFEGGAQHEVGIAKPFQLSIAEGTPPRMPLTLTVMGVNARSKNLDSAIKYLENYIQGLSPEMRAMLNPSLNEAIPNENADEQNQWMTGYENSLKEEAAKAEGAQKTELEEQLARTLKEHEAIRENNKWRVRKEAIDMYRGLMKTAFVSGWGDLNMVISNADMQKLLTRFVQGQMPLEQFLQEAEGKLRLMRLENQ